MSPEQLLKRLKSLAGSLTIGQQATLALTFLAVVTLIVGASYWLESGSYRLLFADMDPESAADVVARLKNQKIDYRLDPGGRGIRVPGDRVDELRLEFVAQGLPSSGRIGFEIFDRTAFGATEFLEQVNYRRALEGEIARTISTLSEVGSARVHIAMAKDSLFGSREQPAKASVVLKLKANRQLAASTVHGITSLVAASVEGLRPESVVIVDTFGRPLARPSDDADEPLSLAQVEKQQRLERDIASRVVALLEPVVGAEHVRVNVSARLNPESQEQTEERWDPNTSVVRSRQTSSDGANGAAAAQGGIAGARANMPAAANPPAAAPTPTASASRSAETTNYEISRVTRHTVRPRGDVARLSVAVLVNHEQTASRDKGGRVTRTSKPRTPEELQKIQALVSTAVGLDAARGDQLTVENIAFDEPVEEQPPAPGVWERYGPQVTEVGRIVAVLLLGLLAFLFVVRPIVRRAVAALPAPGPAAPRLAAALPQHLPRTVEDLEGEIEAQLDAAVAAKASEHRKLPILAKRLGTMAQKEPDSAARLLRTWLND